MLIIPTLDLAGGRAVHARAGDRSRYQPVESALCRNAPGDPLALARAYRRLGCTTCYVADLDAITAGSPQRALLQRLADPRDGFGAGLVVDAGVSDPTSARWIVELGASRVVVGLETLRAFDDLAEITETMGDERVVFSLDLRDGVPIRHPTLSVAPGTAPVELAELARRAGVTTILLLDAARVGTGRGVDLSLVAQLRERLPEVVLWAGGGVRSGRDLDALATAGCAAAVVGTALHTGAILPYSSIR
ncbi:MAG TPA: HisA/HisF-related TIM barrel protein [Gemmatimonadales bacterium]|nr:HisA/HisF-related TIM barrel protein [Gemmatimonadales bacterium]